MEADSIKSEQRASPTQQNIIKIDNKDECGEWGRIN